MAELTEGIEARVVSAAALGESRFFALENALSQKLGIRVNLTASVDPTVIGGLYIHAGDRIIDRTVRKQLSDLKDSLKRRSGDDLQGR